MKKPDLSLILIATLALVLGVAAEAQQPKKVLLIGYLLGEAIQLLSPPVPREFDWRCASVAI